MEPYVTIQKWMRNELNLSGNELIVYAIIYGFSQDGQSRFRGSRQYLADWCGCTVRSIQTTLNTLVESNLITKYEIDINGMKICEYVANFTPSEKISPPSEKISLYNIDNNIGNTITINSNSKDDGNCSDYDSHAYSPKDLKENFLGSSKHSKKRTNLYTKCVDAIHEYTDDAVLQGVLVQYLSVRLAIKDKPIYGLPQWKGLLNRLSTITGDKVKIVMQSVEKGWCSFYDLKDTNTSSSGIFSEFGKVDCEKRDDAYGNKAF